MCVVSTKFGPWSSLSLFPLESTLSIVAHSLTLIGPNRGEEEGLRWVIFLPWAAQTAKDRRCVRVTVWRIFPGPNVDWGASRMQNFLFRKTVQFSFLFNPRGLSRSACEEGVDRARTFGRAHFPGFAAGIEIKFSGLGKKNRARFSRLLKGKKGALIVISSLLFFLLTTALFWGESSKYHTFHALWLLAYQENAQRKSMITS